MHPVELYKENVYRVAHSQEEVFALAKAGWSLDREEGVSYIPITAAPPSGERVIPSREASGRAMREALAQKGAALEKAAANERATKMAAAQNG